MDANEAYKYASWCHQHHITIYPKPANSGLYKIVINRSGKENFGSESYGSKPITKSVKVETPSGIIKKMIDLPSVWDKINHLYRDTYLKNNKQ